MNQMTRTVLDSAVQSYLIADMDPLGLDAFFAYFPQALRMGVTRMLLEELAASLPDLWEIGELYAVEAIAAWRDVAFLAAGLTGAGVDLPQVLPHLHQCLLCLAERTGLPPCLTFEAYVLWNPVDVRQRHFETHAGETAVIRALQKQAWLMDEAEISWPCVRTAWGMVVGDEGKRSFLPRALQCQIEVLICQA